MDLKQVLLVLHAGAPADLALRLAAPARGAEYVEYQAPLELHSRFLVGSLVVCTGLLLGGLLLVSGRRASGSILGGLTIASGLILIVSRRLGWF